MILMMEGFYMNLKLINVGGTQPTVRKDVGLLYMNRQIINIEEH